MGFVAFVYVSEAVQTALISVDSYRIFASGWGDLQALDIFGYGWLSVSIFDGISQWYLLLSRILLSDRLIVSGLIQLFCAWRVHKLSGNIYPALVIAIVRMVFETPHSLLM